MMVIPQKLKEKVKLKDRISRINKFLHGSNGNEQAESGVNTKGAAATSGVGSSNVGDGDKRDNNDQDKKTIWSSFHIYC